MSKDKTSAELNEKETETLDFSPTPADGKENVLSMTDNRAPAAKESGRAEGKPASKTKRSKSKSGAKAESKEGQKAESKDNAGAESKDNPNPPVTIEEKQEPESATQSSAESLPKEAEQGSPETQKSEPVQSSSDAQLNREDSSMQAPAASSEVGFNFSRDEVKTLLVPVPPLKRLIGIVITLACFGTLAYISFQPPIISPIGGVHTIEIPEPGTYVTMFKGKIEDPFGWVPEGRFRRSLKIEVQPVFENQGVTRIKPFKNISAPNCFSVAEFDINAAGKYLCWSEWQEPNESCPGQLYFEKDPVELFMIKWAVGILGTLAFFYSLGVPMSSRAAQSTLPAANIAKQ